MRFLRSIGMRSMVVSPLLVVIMFATSFVVWSNGVATATGPTGIVPLGSTNEGLPGGSSRTTTGIVDIVGGPCVGIALTITKIEQIPTRITLFRGIRVMAKWEIYGYQRIAWVEPVGRYSATASDLTSMGRVGLVVSKSKTALVNLDPGCQ